jgi:hypothetical protein
MKQRTNLTLDGDLRRMAEDLMHLLRYRHLSDLIEQLIREEHQRRHGYLQFPAEPNLKAAEQPTSYRTQKPKPRAPKDSSSDELKEMAANLLRKAAESLPPDDPPPPPGHAPTGANT